MFAVEVKEEDDYVRVDSHCPHAAMDAVEEAGYTPIRAYPLEERRTAVTSAREIGGVYRDNPVAMCIMAAAVLMMLIAIFGGA